MENLDVRRFLHVVGREFLSGGLQRREVVSEAEHAGAHFEKGLVRMKFRDKPLGTDNAVGLIVYADEDYPAPPDAEAKTVAGAICTALESVAREPVGSPGGNTARRRYVERPLSDFIG